MPGEHVPSVRHGVPVGMQVTLGCCECAVAHDLSERVDGHTGVGHPGQPGVPQAVALQVLVAKLRDDFVPRRGVAQGGGGNPSAFGPVSSRASGS